LPNNNCQHPKRLTEASKGRATGAHDRTSIDGSEAEGKQPKKAKIEEKDDAVDADPLFVELAAAQNKIDGTLDAQNEEMLEIEAKYSKTRAPLYKARDAVISKMQNGFWLQALKGHGELSLAMEPCDFEILQDCTGLQVIDKPDMKLGYVVVFMFKPNKFFSDEKLQKDFDLSGEAVKAKPSAVHWKDPEFPKSNPDSFFVTWFDPEGDQVEELGDVLRDLVKAPLEYFLAGVEMDNAGDDDAEGDEGGDGGPDE